MPVEAAKIQQAARLASQIGDHGFILDFMNRQRQNAPPMRHLFEINAVISAKFAEIIAPLLTHGEICSEAGYAGIQRAAAAVNDAGIGKQQGNEAQIFIVVRHLVTDLGLVAVSVESRHIEFFGARPIAFIEPGQGRWIFALSLGPFGKSMRDFGDERQFAQAGDLWVAGQNLLGQCGARAWHADNENRYRPCGRLMQTALEKRRIEDRLVTGEYFPTVRGSVFDGLAPQACAIRPMGKGRIMIAAVAFNLSGGIVQSGALAVAPISPGKSGIQVIGKRISLGHAPRISIVSTRLGKASIQSDRLAEMRNRVLDTAARLQRAAHIHMPHGGGRIEPQGGLAVTHRFINAPEVMHRLTQIDVRLGEIRIHCDGLFIMRNSRVALSLLP